VSSTATPTVAEQQLRQAEGHEAAGELSQAERIYLAILDELPGHAAASLRLAQLAVDRRDLVRAEHLLRLAHDTSPDDVEVAIMLSTVLGAADRAGEALAPLERLLGRNPDAQVAWLLLGIARSRVGDAQGALKASYQAVTRAWRAGQWLDQASTPPHLLRVVTDAVQRVRRGRRELFFDAFADLKAQHGAQALARMDRALRAYLKETEDGPTDPRQRPLFFYFPGLPDTGFHDPLLVPWAARLRDAFPDIRAEALRVAGEDQDALPDFVRLPKGQDMGKYVAGDSPDPRWQAFFFYRRGQRYDENHARCPKTSAVFESLSLCRIDAQAPEICFSVLRPGTTIQAHHGVTNTRLVLHLGLVVPEDCALNLVGLESRAEREGELMLFDDTFLHEAWNRSHRNRIIVLMDCWNPHLTPIEQLACKQLVETVSSLHPPSQAN